MCLVTVFFVIANIVKVIVTNSIKKIPATVITDVNLDSFYKYVGEMPAKIYRTEIVGKSGCI